MSFLPARINAPGKILLQDLPTAAVQLENLSGNSRLQLVCIEKQPMFCHETNNAVSESAWACTWLNVHVPKRLPFARSRQLLPNCGFFKQPQANLYCTSYCCFTAARSFHLNWSLLVSGHNFGLGMSFGSHKLIYIAHYCTSFNDRQTIRLNRSLVVCSLWAEATY